jgi:PAS domain S-box-containing protein
MNDDEINEIGILQGAVENTNEAFVTIDQDHRVLFFNRAAERIFGYDRKEVIGQDLCIVLGPRCSEEHRQAVARYVKTRNPRLIGHETEFLATRKNGETFPAVISFSVAEIGARLFFTGILRDVTETKALEDRISRAERLAALGRVVAEISHEIKNPLMVIGGFARQLMGTAQDGKTRSRLQIIADETRRLENLLGDLRDFYAPTRLDLETIDVNDLLREVYSLTKGDCQTRKIQITLDMQQGPAYARGDRSRLKQVFLNLAKNAAEAMESGGHLSIQSKSTGNTVEVTISDDGPGIPESVQEKVFAPFFTTKKHGTGLGLCISKRIIEDHPGCAFTLTSKAGKGTVVGITLATGRWSGRLGGSSDKTKG